MQTLIYISLTKEQNDHNTGEVCINSLGWYDTNTTITTTNDDNNKGLL